MSTLQPNFGCRVFIDWFSSWIYFSIDIFSSGHSVRPYCMPGSAVNDCYRDPRSLRRRKRNLVATVWKHRTTKIRADIDHFVPQLDVRSRCLWPETGNGYSIRKYFSERKTRLVLNFYAIIILYYCVCYCVGIVLYFMRSSFWSVVKRL